MRAVAIAIALAGCGRVHFAELGDGAAPDAGVRVTLKLDKVAPAMDITDFVLPVVLDSSRIDLGVLNPDASDLEFFDSAGNDLELEIEQLGPPIIAWVRVPTISGVTTTLDMRYGTPRDVPRRTPWDSSYDAVYHFAKGLGTESATAANATNMGAVATPGVLGDGIALGGSQYLVVPTSTSIASGVFTVEGWIKVTALPAGYYALVAREWSTGSDDDIYLGVQGNQVLATCEVANVEDDALGGTVTAGNWVYLAGTAHAMAVHSYVEGVQVASVTTGGTLQHSTGALFIGADSNGGGSVPQNDFLVGALDEIRISNVIRPNYWLKYSAAAFRDQVITYP